jgi:hypothetical protein
MSEPHVVLCVISLTLKFRGVRSRQGLRTPALGELHGWLRRWNLTCAILLGPSRAALMGA